MPELWSYTTFLMPIYANLCHILFKTNNLGLDSYSTCPKPLTNQILLKSGQKCLSYGATPLFCCQFTPIYVTIFVKQLILVQILILHVLSHSQTKFYQNWARNSRVMELRHFFVANLSQFTPIYATFFWKTIYLGLDSYSTCPKPHTNQILSKQSQKCQSYRATPFLA